MSSLIVLQIIFFLGTIVHIWFKSDFLPYYASISKELIPQKIYLWLLIDEFFNRSGDDNVYEHYIEYLYSKRCFAKSPYTRFYLKLFSCPTCFTFWLSMLIGAISLTPFNIGIYFVGAQAVYTLLNYFLKI